MCKDRRAGVHIYKAMALLASTRDVSEFEYGWEALVHRFREMEPDTVVHLREMYYRRKQLWALAFRGPDEEVTNNVVEVRMWEGETETKTLYVHVCMYVCVRCSSFSRVSLAAFTSSSVSCVCPSLHYTHPHTHLRLCLSPPPPLLPAVPLPV